MKSLLVLGAVLFAIPAAFADGSIGYEAGPLTIKPNAGNSYSLLAHRISVYDTTGGLTAGIRGAINQNAAQKAKEGEVQNSVKNGTAAPQGANVSQVNGQAVGSYSYAWNQPAPVPTDGELWSLILASEGNPLIDPISPPPASTQRSVLGIEYTRGLWDYVSAPISYGIGFGLRVYMFSTAATSDTAISVPITFTASSQILNHVIAYGEFGIGPVYAVQGKPFYLDYEVGVKWEFAGSWQAVGTFRGTQDSLSKNDVDGKPIKYSMTLMNAGIRYVF
jgi:hypothetical protein